MTEATALGIPTIHAQALVLVARRPTHEIRVDSLNVGRDVPITVQSMITTKARDTGTALQQVVELTAMGCDIAHIAYPTDKDAGALPIIAKQSRVPVITDIHFSPEYVFAAIEAGCGVVRVNPGNIHKFDDQVADIYKAAPGAGISLRIDVNAGFLDKRLLKKYGKATPEVLVESATWETEFFEESGFHDFKIFVKHYDAVTIVQAYRLLSEAGQWPLRLGVTEAGLAFQGTIRSCAAFGTLLAEGTDDIVQVSLSTPPVEEVKVGAKLLEFMGPREYQLEIISYPSCGRARVDAWTLTEEVEAGLEKITAPLRMTVMGCVINGPGEAREVDLGCASGNGKGQIFVRSRVVETVLGDQVVGTLLKHTETMAAEMAEELREETLAGTSPMVPAVG